MGLGATPARLGHRGLMAVIIHASTIPAPPGPKPTEIITSTVECNTEIRWGKFSFPVDGREVKLTVFLRVGEEVFFLPFADSNSSSETYGAGKCREVVP